MEGNDGFAVGGGQEEGFLVGPVGPLVVDVVVDGLLADAALLGQLLDGEVIVFFPLSEEEAFEPFPAEVGLSVKVGQGDAGFRGAGFDGLPVFLELLGGFVQGHVPLALRLIFLDAGRDQWEGVPGVLDFLEVNAVGPWAELDERGFAALDHGVDGGAGNVEDPFYCFHLYIIFRVCKYRLGAAFVNWCKAAGIFRGGPGFWPFFILHPTLKVQMWYKYNEKKDKKQ